MIPRLGTRLLLLVVATSVLTLAASLWLGLRFQREVLDETKAQLDSLSKALQIAVQHMTAAPGESDEDLLRDYVSRLAGRGVREISIVGNDQQVIASSDASKVGHRADRRRREPLVITGTLGTQVAPTPGTVHELDIPIVVDDTLRGTVRLALVLDDFDAFVRGAQRQRLAATAAVLLAGLAGIVLLGRRLTRDVDRISAALAAVGRGELPEPLPLTSRDDVGRLAGTFNHMLDALRGRRELEERLRRAERSAALANMARAVAHEVRNPLNLVGLSLDHLRDVHAPDDPARAAAYRRLLDGARDDLRRLDELVGHVLEIGRLPRLTIAPCDAAALLEDVRVSTEVQAAQRGIALSFEAEPGLPPIAADRDALYRCLLNLALNALQATPEGGRVTLRARAGAADGRVVLEVEDTGPGIAAADLETIFEPFVSKRDGGFGLGLAVSRQIVEDHGGRLSAASREGAGATFRVEIPAASSAAPARATEEA